MNKKEFELKDHQLFAASGKLWKTLRKENEISSGKMKLARKITRFVTLLGPFRAMQRLIIKSRIKNTNLKDDAPIFVVGHWRSGTTHLHYLLAQDDRYMQLGSFQAFFFNIAFTTKWFFKPILKRVMPTTRPQDNVKIDTDSPSEDEHALVNMTHMSGMHLFFFPNQKDYFNKYNCFDGISKEELQEWKSIYSSLLKQVELYNKEDKKLLLKNPHSTARIKVLSEMYPKAKFIFIHRNPYDVFKSTMTLYEKALQSQFLQEFSKQEQNELIVYCYEKMMSDYLLQRQDIPSDQLIEVRYDDLIAEPILELEKIYNQINLGEFQITKPKLEVYLNSLKSYKTNPSKAIDPAMKELIKTRWGFAFKEWGYKM